MEHRRPVARPGFSLVQRGRSALWINSGGPSREGLPYQANKDAQWRQERIVLDWCRCWRWLSRGECVVHEWRELKRSRDGHRNRWFALRDGLAFALRIFLERQSRLRTGRRNSALIRSFAPP